MSTGLPISQWPSDLINYPTDWSQFFVPAGDDVPGNATSKALFADFQRLMQGRVATVAVLRALDATNIPDGTRLQLDGHTTAPLGGGTFTLIKSGAVGANKDDNGVTIHAAGGPVVTDPGAWYWQRILNGKPVLPDDFGALGDADISVRPGVPTPSDGGTDDAVALQAWLNYGTAGIGDNGFQHSIIRPADLMLGPRVYRTNTGLTYNVPTGGNQSIRGAGGRRQSFIVAGAAMPTLLNCVTGDPLAALTSLDIADISFSGMDYADVGVNAYGATYTSWRRMRIQSCTTTLFRVSGWNNLVERCDFIGSNFDGSSRVAIGVEIPAGTVNCNGITFVNCSFNRCLRGLDCSQTVQQLNIEGACLFDAIQEAAIVMRVGSRNMIVDGNYFEDNGTDPTSIEVDTGDTRNLSGAIVLSRAPNSGVETIRGMKIQRNRFSDMKCRAIVAGSGLDELDYSQNSLRSDSPIEHIVSLHRDGSFYTTASRVRFQQSVGNKGRTFSVSSADPGTDTLTISSTALAQGIPIRITGSNVGGLADGRYWSASRGLGQLSLQLAATQKAALAGTPLVDITSTGTASGAIEDTVAEPVSVDDVSSIVNGTNIEVDVTKRSASLRGYHGAVSLGGNPNTWLNGTGVFTITNAGTGFEASPALQFDSTGAAEKRFNFTLEQEDANNFYTIRGRYFRVHGIVQVLSGSGLEVQWFINTGSGLTQYASQLRNSSTWAPYRGFLVPVPKDATDIRVTIRSTAATSAKLARFCICDAAIPNDVIQPITDAPI